MLLPAPCVSPQLDEIHGQKMDHGPNRSEWGEAWGTFQNASHGHLGWYMHEEDLDLLPNETVVHWRPPEWATDWVGRRVPLFQTSEFGPAATRDSLYCYWLPTFQHVGMISSSFQDMQRHDVCAVNSRGPV
eukprot:350888-Chlamydomonas_euryale.AAC.8